MGGIVSLLGSAFSAFASWLGIKKTNQDQAAGGAIQRDETLTENLAVAAAAVRIEDESETLSTEELRAEVRKDAAGE